MFHVRLTGHEFDEAIDDMGAAIERCKQLRTIYIASDYYVEDEHGTAIFPKRVKSSYITPFNTRHEEYDE